MGMCLPLSLQSSCTKPDVEADIAEIQQKQEKNSNDMKMLTPENIISSQEVGVAQEKASDGIINDFVGFLLLYHLIAD